MTDLNQEIDELRHELEQKKKEIRDLTKLVRRDIDRDFPLEIRELSEKELEDYFRDAVDPLKLVVDPRPGPKSVRSHRKVFGTPIVLLKRLFLWLAGFYTHLLLDDQAKFNRRSAELTEALVTRVGHYRERLEEAEAKVAAFEEDLVILRRKLEDLRSRLPDSPPGGNEPPTR
jgi:chromosome segregation ATPase